MALAMSVLALPAQAAQPSSAELMLAAGAGQEFTPMTTSGARASACATDATDDVVNLEQNESTIDEPRADITDYCVDHGVTSVTLTTQMDSPTDPTDDVNWQGSQLGWFIDTTGDDSGEFFAVLSLTDAGQITARVDDRRSDEVTTICDDVFSRYADGELTIRFSRDCVANADSLSGSVGMIYDQRISNTSGKLAFDSAPGGSDFTGPLAQGSLTDPGVNRIAGDERIGSAILGSQAAFEDEAAEAVVIARSDVPADAVAGTPLAITVDGPLLLSNSSSLAEATGAEVDRVLPAGGTVYLLGGEAALSPAVASALTSAGYDVIRLGGDNRFETATVIATEGLGSPTTVLLADGAGFADALVAGAASSAVVAGDGVAAVLLSDGTRAPAETTEYLNAVTPTTIAVGEAAAAAYPEADTSYVGDSPAGTSVAVARGVFDAPTIAGLARDDQFADALFGGALIGDPSIGPGPLLLTGSQSLDSEVRDYLEANAASLETIVIFGGPVAISEDVEADVLATQE